MTHAVGKHIERFSRRFTHGCGLAAQCAKVKHCAVSYVALENAWEPGKPAMSTLASDWSTAFFMPCLTEPGALVLEPCAGSNITGAAAEYLGRHWRSMAPQAEPEEGSDRSQQGSLLA
jgi:hypothetical protein